MGPKRGRNKYQCSECGAILIGSVSASRHRCQFGHKVPMKRIGYEFDITSK